MVPHDVVRHPSDGIGKALMAAMVSWSQLRLHDWMAIWDGCLRRIRGWRVPPHWSASDWFEEMQAQGAAAALQAIRDYDAARGVALGTFVRWRIMSGALTRYRQEWAYALHCGGAEPCDSFAEAAPPSAAIQESVCRDLARLPGPDRWLIERLFWDGCTEAAVASALGVSQPAVSKRKRAILDELRLRIGSPEK
jgi:hypothetical protein